MVDSVITLKITQQRGKYGISSILEYKTRKLENWKANDVKKFKSLMKGST